MGWAAWESLSSPRWAGQQARAGGEACCLHERGWKERLMFRNSKAFPSLGLSFPISKMRRLLQNADSQPRLHEMSSLAAQRGHVCERCCLPGRAPLTTLGFPCIIKDVRNFQPELLATVQQIESVSFHANAGKAPSWPGVQCSLGNLKIAKSTLSIPTPGDAGSVPR